MECCKRVDLQRVRDWPSPLIHNINLGVQWIWTVLELRYLAQKTTSFQNTSYIISLSRIAMQSLWPHLTDGVD
jgi:hypothetical protein